MATFSRTSQKSGDPQSKCQSRDIAIWGFRERSQRIRLADLVPLHTVRGLRFSIARVCVYAYVHIWDYAEGGEERNRGRSANAAWPLLVK